MLVGSSRTDKCARWGKIEVWDDKVDVDQSC